MMAESITIARPYAKAAFQAAKDSQALTEWSEMLGYVSAVAVDENMEAVLDNPALTSDRKVVIASTVNQELIGGVIIRANDLVIDASVRGKIAKLAEAISA
jgi:F0F1-type ATP synthase delta subunit